MNICFSFSVVGWSFLPLFPSSLFTPPFFFRLFFFSFVQCKIYISDYEQYNDNLLGEYGSPEKGFWGGCCDVGLWKTARLVAHHLLGAGVLGDGLGSFRDGVLSQLSGEEESDSRLDLPGGDGGPLVVVGQTGGLSGDSFEDVVDERVHDAHGLGRDASVRVDLLQHLVDVDGVGFLSLLLLFLVAGSTGGLSLTRLLGTLGGNFGRHDENWFCFAWRANFRTQLNSSFYIGALDQRRRKASMALSDWPA